jgi:hypothetical protein
MRTVYLKLTLSFVCSLLVCALFAQNATITSFSPISGPVGTTVTINGSDFNPVASNNIVWFGSVRATVQSASSTQLAVTVPAGSSNQPLAVITNNSVAYSQRPFIVTYPAGSVIFHNNSFAAKVDSTTGMTPYAVAVADFDDDGMCEIITANYGAASVSILRNTSSVGVISFAPKVDLAASASPTAVAVADFNSDGKQDIAVTNGSAATVSIFINNSSAGTISFNSKIDFATATFPVGIAAADLDADGQVDLAVTNANAASFSVLRNTSSAAGLSFASKVDFTTGNSPFGIVSRDLDRDGKVDIAVSNNSSNSISVFLNASTSGTIAFSSKVDFATGSGPKGVAVGDVDGDGKDELAVANSISNSISILRNTSTSGTISFAPKLDSLLGTGVNTQQHISISDLNGDGKPEVVSVNRGGNLLHIFKNHSTVGTINLSARQNYTTTATPHHFVIADCDNDGKDDIAIAHSTANKVSILRTTAPPVITAVSPEITAAGTSLTITGHNFLPALTKNLVRFGAVKASLTSATPTSLIVTVPPGATFQQISVTTDGLTGFAKSNFVQSFAGGDTTLENSFAPKVDLPNTAIPKESAIADVDGDGLADIIAVTHTQQISIYRNSGTPGLLNFAAPVNITGYSGAVNVATGDLNGDGNLDFATANGEYNTVSLYRNTTSASTPVSFAAKIDLIEAGAVPHSVAIVEINGDGKPDLVVGSTTHVTIFLNNSNGSTLSFIKKISHSANGSSNSTSIADIDGDGRIDIIQGGYYGAYCLRNSSVDGIISFSPAITVTTAASTGSVAADLNADGKTDLAFIHSNENKLDLFTNTSSATGISFALSQTLTTGLYPNDIAASDLNGDGKVDVAVSGLEYDAISVYKNNSSGSINFLAKVDYSTNIEPHSITIGDLDNDGKPDLVTTNLKPNTLSILRLNRYTAQPLVPVISSFSPPSGAAGTMVTITGNNFGTSVAQNIVFFGAVKAEVTSASATQLIVKVPAGATFQPIRVINQHKLTAFSAKPFVLTFPGAGNFTSTSLDPFKHFIPGQNPKMMYMADIDGDGKSDLLLPNHDANTVSILRNTSTPGIVNFATKIDFAVGDKPTAVTAADIDDDGKPEVIVTNSTYNTFSLLKNNSSIGNISLQPQQVFSTDIQGFGFPNSIAVGDLDGDGKADVAIANQNSQYISLFRNTTTGNTISFAPHVYFEAPNEPRSIAIHDFDGNGKADIVVTNYAKQAMVFSNTSSPGSISFTAPLKYPGGHGWGNAVAADYDGDGKADVVVAGDNNSSFSVLKNQSIRNSFSFAPKTNHGNTSYAYAVAAGDLNGDGKIDVANIDYFGNAVALSANKSVDSFSFHPLVKYSLGSNVTSPTGITIGDVDGDGKPDLALSSTVPNLVMVLRNRMTEGFRFCPGGSGALTSSLRGSSYQWQLSTDSINFSNISNNANYAGVNSDTLSLSNLPSSWSGYLYRCIVDGKVSEWLGIRFSNTWTGAANNSWENPANWSCGSAPDVHTDVVINAGANITLSTNVTIARLHLHPGATLTIAAGGNLVLTGR